MIKIKKSFLPSILTIVSCLSLALSYFFLQPRISNIVPFIREIRLSGFIKNTIKNNHISAQEFWKLREFYSPGTISISKPDLSFISDKIISKETLIDNKILFDSLFPKLDGWKIIFIKPNELITTKNNETLIFFIKSISEMSQANGFFDYKDKDKKLLENKNWYVVTKIQK